MRTTTRSPSNPGGTETAGVMPGRVGGWLASATSQASWTAWSPITASCGSRPPLITWSSTVSPGTRSTAGGENTSSRAMMLTSRGLAEVPGLTGGVVVGARPGRD